MKHWSLALADTSPAQSWAEPVTLTEAKKQARIDGSHEDAYIESILIPAARQHCEKLQGSALVNRQWVLTMDAFPSGRILEIPLRPVVSIQSVTYIDPSGTLQTLDAAEYIVDVASFHARLQAVTDWPATADQISAVHVAFTAGPEDAAPESIKQAVLLLVCHWFDNRGAVDTSSVSREVDFAVTALLNPDRSYTFA